MKERLKELIEDIKDDPVIWAGLGLSIISLIISIISLVNAVSAYFID